jgi:hypothetical protein
MELSISRKKCQLWSTLTHGYKPFDQCFIHSSSFVLIMHGMAIGKGPAREGVRGGLEQFKWEGVKGMSYSDREKYLGASVMVGQLGMFYFSLFLPR